MMRSVPAVQKYALGHRKCMVTVKIPAYLSEKMCVFIVCPVFLLARAIIRP